MGMKWEFLILTHIIAFLCGAAMAIDHSAVKKVFRAIWFMLRRWFIRKKYDGWMP